MSEEEFEAACDEATVMEEAMNRLPPQTMTEFAAELLCVSDNGEWALPEGPGGLVSDCKAILMGAGIDPRLDRGRHV